MKRFKLAAVGGTFDIIHDGHAALLSESFGVADMVIIGLVGDALAAKRQKRPRNGYAKRLEALRRFIGQRFPDGRFRISRLDDDFGPAALEAGVQVLVLSEETKPQGAVLNRLRSESGSPPVCIITVPTVLAADGKKISSSRIRDSEIDPAGNLL